MQIGGEQSGYERHGLKHTSASQINTWADAPCYWLASKIFGTKGVFGAAPKAGVLVEDAVVKVLQGATEEEAAQEAVRLYNMHVGLFPSTADTKRGNGIPNMIKQAVDYLKQFGEPTFTSAGGQMPSKLNCKGDGWELPIIGFIDFYYPQHNLIIDLKTTMRLPTYMSADHKRQSSIYEKSFEGCEVKFLYVTPTGNKVLRHDDVNTTLGEIKTLLNRQERFLASGDAEHLISIVPVNVHSIRWRGCEKAREEIYKL